MELRIMDATFKRELRERLRYQGCEDRQHANRIYSGLMAERTAFTDEDYIYDGIMRQLPVTRTPDAQARAIRSDVQTFRLSDGVEHIVKVTYKDGTTIYRRPSEFRPEREVSHTINASIADDVAKANAHKAMLAKMGTQADID